MASRRLVIGTTIKEQLTTSFFPHLPAFVADGWDIHLVAAPGPWPGAQPPGNATVHEIEMAKEISPGADARALMQWRQLLRQLQPQAVVAGSPKGALLAMLAARSVGVPQRIYLHRGARWESLTGWRRDVTLRADRATVAAATEVVAVSTSLADVLRRADVCTAPPVILGAGGSKGVDLERFRPDPEAWPSEPVLGYVGRVSHDKGLDVALEALAQLQLVRPQARLMVVGELDGADPPTTEVLHRLNSLPGVQWLGWRTDVAELMRGFTVLLLPSAREGLPNAVIEAAASGVPAIGWDVTGVRDAINDGVSGILVTWRDADAFAAAAVAVAIDPDLAGWRERARKWSERFDQRRVTSAWLELLSATPLAGTPAQLDAAAPDAASAAAQPEPAQLGVVIVTYRSQATIGDCVASLATHAPGAHVVIVDNSAEADDIARIAAAAEDQSRGQLGSLQVVPARENIGYAAGVNLGMMHLPGICKYLLICNPDVVITTNPLRLVGGLALADVTAGHLLGELPNTSKATTYGSELLRGFAGMRFRHEHLPSGSGAHYTQQLAGAYLLQRLDYYREHPLSESFELYYEDVAYCDTAREQGRGVLLQDVVVGTHIGGASSGRVSPSAYVVGRVSRARYLRSRYPRLPGPVLALPFAVEYGVRSLTRQGEGQQARADAVRAVQAELAEPGSVRVLASQPVSDTPGST